MKVTVTLTPNQMALLQEFSTNRQPDSAHYAGYKIPVYAVHADVVVHDGYSSEYEARLQGEFLTYESAQRYIDEQGNRLLNPEIYKMDGNLLSKNNDNYDLLSVLNELGKQVMTCD